MPPKASPNESIRFKSEVLDAVNGWLGDYNVPTRALTAARPGVRLGIGAVPPRTKESADTGFLKRLLRKRQREDEDEQEDLDDEYNDEDSRFSQLTKRGGSGGLVASSPATVSATAPHRSIRASKEPKSKCRRQSAHPTNPQRASIRTARGHTS